MKTADYVVQQRKLVMYVVLLGSLLSLGGCVNRVLPPFSLSNDKFIGVESNIEKNTNSIRTQNKVTRSDSNLAEEPKGLDSYAGFNAALKKANVSIKNGNLDDSNANADLLIAGMNLITGNCSRYFNDLGKIGQNTSFARKETTLIGSATAAVMGLADAGSKAISATATGFGFTTSTIDNFSDVYLFSPEIKNVQDLVIGALKIQMDDGYKIAQDAKLNPDKDPLTYTEVTQLLFQMESTCQPHSIHQLINTAVANNKVVPTFEESSVEQLQSTIDEFKAKADNAAEKLNIKKTSNLNRNQKEFTPSNLLMQKLKAEDELNRATTDASVIQKQLNDLEGKSDQESIARKAALENIKTTTNSKITEKKSNFEIAQRKLVEYETALIIYKVLDQYAFEAKKEAAEDEKNYEEAKAKQENKPTQMELDNFKNKAEKSKDKAIKLRKMATEEAQKINYPSNSITTMDKTKRSLKYELQAK